jgi:hypothetical protein
MDELIIWLTVLFIALWVVKMIYDLGFAGGYREANLKCFNERIEEIKQRSKN